MRISGSGLAQIGIRIVLHTLQSSEHRGRGQSARLGPRRSVTASIAATFPEPQRGRKGRRAVQFHEHASQTRGDRDETRSGRRREALDIGRVVPWRAGVRWLHKRSIAVSLGLADPPVIVTPTTPADEVARLMLLERADAAVVVDDSGALRGIICDAAFLPSQHHFALGRGDALKLFGQWTSPAEIERSYATASDITALQIMHAPQVVATAGEPVGDVLGRMARLGCDCAPVLRDGKVVGVLGRRESLRLAAWRAGPSERLLRQTHSKPSREPSDKRTGRTSTRLSPAT
jgi:CBS domain-containing protein